MKIRTSIMVLICLCALSGLASGYDVNKDLKNVGATSAYDVAVILSGTETVTNTFKGYSDGYFHSVSFGPDGSNTKIRFWDFDDNDNNQIDPNQVIHIGWSTIDHSSEVLDMYWTDQNGQPITGKIYNITSRWTYNRTTKVVSAVWFNHFIAASPITVSDIYSAVLPERIPLEELNANNAALEARLSFRNAGSTILYGDSLIVQVPTVGDDPYVVLRYRVTGSGTGAEALDFVQFQVGSGLVPSLTQWGMLALALMILAAGAMVIVRHRRAAVRT